MDIDRNLGYFSFWYRLTESEKRDIFRACYHAGYAKDYDAFIKKREEWLDLCKQYGERQTQELRGEFLPDRDNLGMRHPDLSFLGYLLDHYGYDDMTEILERNFYIYDHEEMNARALIFLGRTIKNKT